MEGIIFIGIQASGKSTFFQRFFYKSHVRISLDMLKTRNRETILLDACIKAKQPFVIDNTNPMRSDRLKYIEKMKAHKFKIKGYYFQSKISECLDRNEMRNAMERIPEVGVKSTYNKLEVPSYDEGFNELYFVYLKGHEFVVEAWKNEV